MDGHVISTVYRDTSHPGAGHNWAIMILYGHLHALPMQLPASLSETQ